MLDQEKTIVLVVVGVVAAVSVFVLWGPSPHRSTRKKGQVIGLVNLGHTCFLNTLLQALASCPIFIDWLSERDENCRMAVTLRKVLQILNGISPEPITDPYTPHEVITTLRLQGWQITPGEQDAHELFIILLDVLEEEFNQTSPQHGCLSHALIGKERGDGPEINSIQSIRSVDGKDEKEFLLRKCKIVKLPTPVPFRGMLSSQLKCSLCGFKSALRFDKVDTLSLALPSFQQGRLTLHQLLESFVKTEIIPNVVCDQCSVNKPEPVRTTAYKALSFGTLPKVLCMHIVRTTLNSVGELCKREDYVDFEEFVAMDDFTHCHRAKMKRVIEKLNGTPLHGAGETKTQSVFPVLNKSTSIENAKHLYRLKAVVEHVGDIHSGHFVTYRKGLLHSSTRHRTDSVQVRGRECTSQQNKGERARWYYTSDCVVRPSTLCEALQARAYMLFYEKCSYRANSFS